MVMMCYDILGYKAVISGWTKVGGKDGSFIVITRVPRRGNVDPWLEPIPELQFWEMNPDGIVDVPQEDVEAILDEEGFKIGDNRIAPAFQRMLK